MQGKRLNLSYEWLHAEYVDKDRDHFDIANELGCHFNSVLRCLRRCGIPSKKKRKVTIDHAGQRFGRLTVVEQVDRGNRAAKWRCRCDCGKETVVAGSTLREGLTRSCGCYRRDLMYNGYGELSGSYWTRVIRGAKSRNLAVEVTIQQAWELFLSQDGKCALTGQPIHIARDLTRKRKTHTASFDRIDSSRGYTLDNVQWVHRDVNRLKNKFSEGFLLAMAKQLLEHHGYTVSGPDTCPREAEATHALVA